MVVLLLKYLFSFAQTTVERRLLCNKHYHILTKNFWDSSRNPVAYVQPILASFINMLNNEHPHNLLQYVHFLPVLSISPSMLTFWFSETSITLSSSFSAIKHGSHAPHWLSLTREILRILGSTTYHSLLPAHLMDIL